MRQVLQFRLDQFLYVARLPETEGELSEKALGLRLTVNACLENFVAARALCSP